ncbi:putative ribonuclease H-like domain-containing protein [Tanacetum coccineum]
MISKKKKPQPSSDAGKKDDESGIDDQEKPEDSSPNVNTVGPNINTASINTVPTTPNTRIHKDHSLDHVIGDVQSGVQTRRMTRSTNEQGFISAVYEGKTHEDLQNCLFACFLSQVEPKKVIQALTDPSWIEVMRDELLQFKLLEVLSLMPHSRDFVVYQMDVKSAFMYGKIEEEVYVCQPTGFEDLEFPNKVYKTGNSQQEVSQFPWEEIDLIGNVRSKLLLPSLLLKQEYVAASSYCGTCVMDFKTNVDYGYNFMIPRLTLTKKKKAPSA